MHVYSGNIRSDIPETLNSRDHLVEELLSVDTWGTVFGIIPLPERVVGDLVRVVTGPNPTSFTIYQVSNTFALYLGSSVSFFQHNLLFVLHMLL